jgi:adenylate cyclase
MPRYTNADDWWRAVLTGVNPDLPYRQLRTFWGRLPTNPRCNMCNAPFKGPVTPLLRLLGKQPSNLTPRLCKQCHDAAARRHGGAEVELSLMFADVRGSTPLAERMSPAGYGRVINRFYSAATDVLVRTNAWVDRLVGDQAIGIYVPGFAGPQHTALAVEAAMDLLRLTGHADENGPWLEVGAGVHRGVAYVGAVGTPEGVTDITVLGDVPNVAARLASRASAGEVLISDAAYEAGGLDMAGLERRRLDLKGKSEQIGVRVVKFRPPAPASHTSKRRPPRPG